MIMLDLYSRYMGNSFTSLTVHIIFHTKIGAPKIEEEHLSRIFHYIGGTIRSMSGHVFIVGGRPDHIHILTSLPSTISLADFVRDIKSNSSKWIKNISPTYEKFSWQEGYGAFSVSESSKEEVINYITNQKLHHQTHSAQKEFESFLKKHGFSLCTDVH